MVKNNITSRKKNIDAADIVCTGAEQDWLGFVQAINSEMLVAEEIRSFIRQYGHYVSLRKTIPGQCGCVLKFAGSPDPNCPLCNGEGKRFTDHLILARKFTPGPDIGAELRSPLGVVHTRVPVFVMEPILTDKNAPTTNDYLAELVLDLDLRTPVRPFQIREVYKISDVEYMRDINGDLAFYQMRCEEKAWERK